MFTVVATSRKTNITVDEGVSLCLLSGCGVDLLLEPDTPSSLLTCKIEIILK